MRMAFILGVFLFVAACSGTARAAEAVFAGGCFWCMESEFEGMDGVSDVQSGYSGGHVENPTYKQVSAGGTGHKEVIQVTYDPDKISFKELLDVYWRNIDPFDEAGQFCDKGDQYSAAIFVANDEERAVAEDSKAKVASRLGAEPVTEILEAAPFYPAEEYHQDYYEKNSWRYKFYRNGCGRDDRLEDVWGKEKK